MVGKASVRSKQSRGNRKLCHSGTPFLLIRPRLNSYSWQYIYKLEYSLWSLGVIRFAQYKIYTLTFYPWCSTRISVVRVETTIASPSPSRSEIREPIISADKRPATVQHGTGIPTTCVSTAVGNIKMANDVRRGEGVGGRFCSTPQKRWEMIRRACGCQFAGHRIINKIALVPRIYIYT